MNKTITLLILGVIFLALLLMVFNTFMREERQGLPASLPEQTRPQADSTLARVPEADSVPAPAPAPAPTAPEFQSSAVLAPPPPQIAPRPEERAALEPPSVAEGVAVNTVPAQIDAGQTAPPAVVPQTTAPSLPSPPKIPAMPEPDARQQGVQNITNIVVYATQEGATLRLVGDAPLTCTSMLLHNPDRLALDCAGQWNVKAPRAPQNKFIKAIRVGRQADGTRFVVDLHRAPASYRLVQTSPQGLDVRLR